MYLLQEEQIKSDLSDSMYITCFLWLMVHIPIQIWAKSDDEKLEILIDEAVRSVQKKMQWNRPENVAMIYRDGIRSTDDDSDEKKSEVEEESERREKEREREEEREENFRGEEKKPVKRKENFLFLFLSKKEKKAEEREG